MLATQKIALGVLAGAAAWELAQAAARFRRRRELFAAAAALAQREGRTLVVVGDPDAGLHTGLARAYDCGDVCVDLAGCPGCPVAIRADLSAPDRPIGGGATTAVIPTGSAVVFVSAVLEYVPDAQAAWREVLRMAGDGDHVFVAFVGDHSATSVFYPGARWVAWREGPRGETLRTRPVTGGEKLALGGGLALLGAAALGVV